MILGSLAVIALLPNEVNTQQPSFELPVELVGFPVIIIAVRLSNFVKKLAYSLNPRTYSNRRRRSASPEEADMIDVDEAEKRIVAELGERVCVFSRVCLYHANRARASAGTSNPQLDWEDILSRYKSSADRNKEFYLLSVFLGDIVGSSKLCTQLAKRRPCTI